VMFGDRVREMGERQEQERHQQIALAKARRLIKLLGASGYMSNTIHSGPPEDMVEKLKASKQALTAALKAQEPRG
jgi:hypothetical protein